MLPNSPLKRLDPRPVRGLGVELKPRGSYPDNLAPIFRLGPLVIGWRVTAAARFGEEIPLTPFLGLESSGCGRVAKIRANAVEIGLWCDDGLGHNYQPERIIPNGHINEDPELSRLLYNPATRR